MGHVRLDREDNSREAWSGWPLGPPCRPKELRRAPGSERISLGPMKSVSCGREYTHTEADLHAHVVS